MSQLKEQRRCWHCFLPRQREYRCPPRKRAFGFAQFGPQCCRCPSCPSHTFSHNNEEGSLGTSMWVCERFLLGIFKILKLTFDWRLVCSKWWNGREMAIRAECRLTLPAESFCSVRVVVVSLYSSQRIAPRQTAMRTLSQSHQKCTSLCTNQYTCRTSTIIAASFTCTAPQVEVLRGHRGRLAKERNWPSPMRWSPLLRRAMQMTLDVWLAGGDSHCRYCALLQTTSLGGISHRNCCALSDKQLSFL